MARERTVPTQLTVKVERINEIAAKIERNFEPVNDEALLINMCDEVALL